MVLRKVKDQPTTVATRTTEFAGNGDEHEELKEPYRRFVLARQRRLTGVEAERRSPPLSGPSQGDAAAEVDEDQESGGGGGARALGCQRRKTMEEISK